MNDRLVTAVGAIAALAFVYFTFVGGGGTPPVTLPLSTEPGRNGYLALADWLREHEVPVVSWRERLDGLLGDDGRLAPAGNILLTTMPPTNGLRDTEIQSLRAWLRRGNTLLVLAALNDSPEWLPLADTNGLAADLTAMTGLSLRSVSSRFGRDEADEDESAADAETGADADTEAEADTDTIVASVAAEEFIALRPVSHPLLDGVGSLVGLSDAESTRWEAFSRLSYNERPYLRLAVDAASDTEAAWQIPLEQGQILLFASGSLFANHLISDSDSPRFVANLLDYHLGPGGAFIFDDMHHGLTVLYDPAAFYRDGRVYATIAFIVAAWFVYLLGSTNRVAPIRPDRNAPKQAQLLAGVGGFMARRLDPRETGLMLFEDWFREIRRHRELDDDVASIWRALAATPTLGTDTLSRLRDHHDRLRQGDAVNLVALHNLIRKARKAIG
jgi:hypothetical protein